ncbi:MAG: hypothetical protein ACLP1E_07400 [Acidimicrobiales bacterium]
MIHNFRSYLDLVELIGLYAELYQTQFRSQASGESPTGDPVLEVADAAASL